MLPCDGCGPPCCTGWYDLLTGLVDVAHQAVLDCTDGGCCGEITKFVSVGEPSHPTLDYVAGWISDVSVAQPFTAAGSDTKMLRYARPTVTLNVKLSEYGWPMIDVPLGDQIIPPSPEAMNAAAVHSYGHAQAMFLASANWLMRDACNDLKALSALRPLTPSAGIAAWMFAAQVMA